MINTSSERPIFVVGSPRSGTTMLRYMLCSHPRIFVPPESNFIPRFLVRRQPNPMSRKQAVRMMNTIRSYSMFFMDWQGSPPDPATFVETLSYLGPATLISALYSEYASQFGAVRWGDKSPINTSYIDLLAESFPSAQVIHIIRDGRDVALSMLDSYRGSRYFYIDICYAAHVWKRRVSKAIASKIRQDADRYFELHYEDLIENPEKLLRELCDFLGEEYDPSMTEPNKIASQLYYSKGIFAATRQPLMKNRVRRWCREMPAVDQRLFQTIAGDLLRELGYATVDVNAITTGEFARYIRLQTKYGIVEAGRRSLQAMGIFHPTDLLSLFLNRDPLPRIDQNLEKTRRAGQTFELQREDKHKRSK